MELLLIALVWILNFGISYMNAKGCGYAWAETKAHGGWPRFLIWMVALMAASGFAWCFLILEVAFGASMGWIALPVAKAALLLGYVILIPGILFSGLVITIDSWARAYREGGVLNYGVAAWNTYAQVHNTYDAVEGMGAAFGSLGDAFSGDGEDSLKAIGILVVCILVLSALILGIVTTRYIILSTAAGSDLLSIDEMRAKRAQ